MAVSDYSTTPSLNISISGIDIGEGCDASGVNDAIRQLMADIAGVYGKYEDGTNRNVTVGPNGAKTGVGDLSVFIGDEAGEGVTDPGGGPGGLQNARGLIAIGGGVLSNGAYDGWDFSIWVGVNAGSEASGGYCGIAIGERAGQYQNATAQYNTLVGATTGQSITSGKNNTYIGAKAGLGPFTVNGTFSTGDNNVGVGVSALTAVTTASDNVAVGALAGQGITSGTRCVLIGTRAGEAVTINSNVVAVGYFALRLNTTADNVGVGYQAAAANTTGAGLVAIGPDSMAANTTGSFNIAIGAEALYSNTAANGSVAIGYRALRNAQNGLNTAAGYQSGFNVTTGTLNAFFGRNAGGAVNTGGQNVAIGDNAVTALTAGNAVTAAGYAALGDVTGSNNTGFGHSAGNAGATGAVAVTSGTNNSFLGHQAGANAADAAGVIAIGKDAVALKATGASSADSGAGFALGSSSNKVGFRGDGVPYTTMGSSAGFAQWRLNGTNYRVPLYATS